MIPNDELQKRQRLIAQILKRYNFEFTPNNDHFRINGGQILFSDFSAPLLYTFAGLILGFLAYWSVGPLEGILIFFVTMLGFLYIGLLYRQKVNLSRTTTDITPEGLTITNPKGEQQVIPQTGIQNLLVVLDPEEKVKTGRLILNSEETGEKTLIKLVGENQKYLKDDLERVRGFMIEYWRL